uniref:Uncharacterized protein n=1 Tax=Entomoneis paludosa TaxID=265537 RepID=A0A7S2V8G2_9STRA|mmetsp:Transcript_11362/g.23296  ORF Transcript_11362/g.23296 Transcript_11362/m.23296 type:complete len:479 (+) Transcript_11362:95-1531(+)
MAEEVIDTTAMEEKARAEAEARRQKILEKAGNRMDLVNGINRDEGEGEEVEKPKKTSASKLAAMRRRRFKKGGAAKKEEETADSAAAAPPVSEADTPKPETTVAPEPAKDQPETVDQAPSVEVESKASEEESPAAATATSEASEPPKRKYMGVAKMRRKMNKERQAKQAEEVGDDASQSTASTTKSVKAAVLKKRRIVATLPIAMHVVTVFLLFLAGVDIGLQQNRIEYALTDVKVHEQIAPQQELRIVQMVTNFGSSSKTKPSTTSPSLDKVVDDPAVYDVGAEDEFQSETDGEEGEENLDPLFQVDLDKLTSGPGLLMMAGRFAVACHRFNLSILYYFPLSIMARIQSTIYSLIQSPPMLCLVALAIRQAIGKLILGADLPEIVKDEAQHKDVMSTVKNFAKSFFLKTFPTVASLYDAFTHLRSDMYVILCGLFVGIAFHHQFGQVFVLPPDVAEDVAPPVVEEPPEQVITGSDEL